MNNPAFLIKSGSSDFLNKQKNIFDLLSVAEKEQDVHRRTHDEYMEIEEDVSKKRKRKETKQFRGKESLFKEPQEPAPRFRRSSKIPDYQRNPHRWVKYSLGDVTQDDMSNASNTAAALDFLKTIKAEKRKINDDKMDEDESCQKESSSSEVKFNAPKKMQFKKANFGEVCEAVVDNNEEDKPVFKSSKWIMPEYVVGQAKKTNKKKEKKKPIEKGKQLHLDHLQDYEDE